eukprot:7159971-Pyramimonas_sp.AAC.1
MFYYLGKPWQSSLQYCYPLPLLRYVGGCLSEILASQANPLPLAQILAHLTKDMPPGAAPFAPLCALRQLALLVVATWAPPGAGPPPDDDSSAYGSLEDQSGASALRAAVEALASGQRRGDELAVDEAEALAEAVVAAGVRALRPLRALTYAHCPYNIFFVLFHGSFCVCDGDYANNTPEADACKVNPSRQIRESNPARNHQLSRCLFQWRRARQVCAGAARPHLPLYRPH